MSYLYLISFDDLFYIILKHRIYQKIMINILSSYISNYMVNH